MIRLNAQQVVSALTACGYLVSAHAHCITVFQGDGQPPQFLRPDRDGMIGFDRLFAVLPDMTIN